VKLFASDRRILKAANKQFGAVFKSTTLQIILFMRETPRSTIFSRTMVLFERCISANIFLWDALEGLILLGIKYLPLRLQFDATKPELYTKTLVEEFIDNIEMSWDDVMTDAIVNCSLVIRGEFYHAINYPRGPR
jgi:hypothetical protein